MPADLRGPPVPSPAFPLAAPGVAAAAAALAFVVGFGAGARGGRAAPVDPCGLPAGIETASLSPRDQTFVVRHALACRDLDHARISADDFRATWREPPPAAAPPAPVWASSVREVSTEYAADRWSASRALGAPDVYPAGGDEANAWASRGADDRVEYLEVGFAPARRIAAVDVFETFNPGAVSRIELIGSDGSRRLAFAGAAEARPRPSFQRHVELDCTDVPIVAVRLTIDSPAVAGWNEIDAVGVTPCE